MSITFTTLAGRYTVADGQVDASPADIWPGVDEAWNLVALDGQIMTPAMGVYEHPDLEVDDGAVVTLVRCWVMRSGDWIVSESGAYPEMRGEEVRIGPSTGVEEFHLDSHDQQSHAGGRRRPIPPPPRGGRGRPRPGGALPDVPFRDVKIAYRPRHPDGKADPGEVVWAQVPFEEGDGRSKDRPVLIIGRTADGEHLVGVQLTSKSGRDRVPVGTGDWDRQARESYMDTDRFIQVDENNYRREGAYLKKPRFQEIVDVLTDRQNAPDVDLAVEVFHLQGQHDQQSHAGGNAVDPTSPASRRGWKPLKGVLSERPIEFDDYENSYRVTAANGEQVEARVFTYNAESNAVLRSPAWKQRIADGLNGVVDGYDMAPLDDGSVPHLIVMDELPLGLPDVAEGAIAFVSSNAPRGPIPNGAPFDSTQLRSNTVVFNATPRGREMWELMEERASEIMMPSVSSTSVANYTGIHEYGHTRAADDYPAVLNNMYGNIRPMSLSNISPEWKALSPYGKTNPAEAHAEAFAEWVLSDGVSDNAAARFYADQLRWGQEREEALAAAAGATRLRDQWVWCFDGPMGGVLVTKAPEGVDFASEPAGSAPDSPVAETSDVTGTETPGNGDGAHMRRFEFHLQGEHDQQTHGGGRPFNSQGKKLAERYQSKPRDLEPGDVVRFKPPKTTDRGATRAGNPRLVVDKVDRKPYSVTVHFDTGEKYTYDNSDGDVLDVEVWEQVEDFSVRQFHLQGQHDQQTHAGGRASTEFEPITAAEARGNSRPVTSDEFQRLAAIGRRQIDELAADTQPITVLDENWTEVQQGAFDAAQESWGGATINARTGEFLASDADRYALTVKDPGFETVSIPEGATQAEFEEAMTAAKEKFRPILERRDHYLGVFHDDDLNRIDFDPVTVVDTLDEVETIGAATRAIGGAYNFADGNGYWPPHVDEERAVVASASMGGMDEKTSFKGPAEWKRQAKQLEGAPDAVKADLATGGMRVFHLEGGHDQQTHAGDAAPKKRRTGMHKTEVNVAQREGREVEYKGKRVKITRVRTVEVTGGNNRTMVTVSDADGNESEVSSRSLRLPDED